jgi:outer membrane autotransporter protein
LSLSTCTIAPIASFISGAVRTSISNDFDRTGWVAGVGVEHAFTRNWSLAVEYTHVDFGSEHVTLPVTNSASRPNS